MSNVHSSFPCSYSYTLQASPPFYIARKATVREHESERRNFSPPTFEWFLATSPSGELARRLSPASVWKRTGKGKLRRSRTRWAREEGRNGIYAHSPYFSVHTSCSRAPYDIPLGSAVLRLSLPHCVQIAFSLCVVFWLDSKIVSNLKIQQCSDALSNLICLKVEYQFWTIYKVSRLALDGLSKAPFI